MLMRFILPAVLLLASTLVSAQSLDINLSSDTAEFKYVAPFSQDSSFGGAEMDLGFLFTTEDDALAYLGAQVFGEAGTNSPGLSAGVGIKAFALAEDRGNYDVAAVTLGGTLRFSPPASNRFGIKAYINYSPNIVTFGDGESFFYGGFRAEYEILPQAVIYIGYRKVETDVGRSANLKIDRGGHVGMQFTF